MQRNLPPFELVYPSTAQDAVNLRSECYSSCYLAGGTHLIPHWRTVERPPELVINLKRVAPWNTDDLVNPSWLTPLATISDLQKHMFSHPGFSGLSTAAREFGAPLIEPLATVTGNLAAARSNCALAAPLITLAAKVHYVSIVGSGHVSVDDLFEKPGCTTLPHGALITAIEIPTPPPNSHGAHLSLRGGTTSSPLIVAASTLVELNDDGTVRGGRLSITNAASTPREVIAAQEILRAHTRLDDIVGDLGQAAADAADPDDDRWGSAKYRKRMTRVVTERLIKSIASIPTTEVATQ